MSAIIDAMPPAIIPAMRSAMSLAIESAVSAFNAVSFSGTDQYGTMPVFVPKSDVFSFIIELQPADRAAEYCLIESVSDLIRVSINTSGFPSVRLNNSGAITTVAGTTAISTSATTLIQVKFFRSTSQITFTVGGSFDESTRELIGGASNSVSATIPTAFAGFSQFFKAADSIGIYKGLCSSIRLVDHYAIQPIEAVASRPTLIANRANAFYGKPETDIILVGDFELEFKTRFSSTANTDIIGNEKLSVARCLYVDVTSANLRAFTFNDTLDPFIASTTGNVIVGEDLLIGIQRIGEVLYLKINGVGVVNTPTGFSDPLILSTIFRRSTSYGDNEPISDFKVWTGGSKTTGTLAHQWDFDSGSYISEPDVIGGNTINFINGTSANIVTLPKLDRTYLINEQSGNLLLDSAGGGSNITLVNYLESQRVTI